MEFMKPMPKCNICGNKEFKPAPFNRLSVNGMPPVCTTCGGLERHRVFREIFNKIRRIGFNNLNCLQFSNDPSIATGWFANHEASIYGASNSLDLQKIDRKDNTYDVVVCNHVLEHVLKYRDAIQELARITKESGFVFLSFPAPVRRTQTEDWGYPKEDLHGHYRSFGRDDIEDEFRQLVPELHVLAISGIDPVTTMNDMAYVLTGSDALFSHIFESGLSARITNIRRVT